MRKRRFWMMWVGYFGAAALWYASVKWLPIESFRRLPDPMTVVTEWLSPNPTFGISIFTYPYYLHILYSTYRATAAFLLAVLLGVPLGDLHGLEPRASTVTHHRCSACCGRYRRSPGCRSRS